MSEVTANFLNDHFGFDLTLACCGKEAICLLNSANDFDLIITDYCMPNGNGKDILDHMNQSKIDTPLILFSGGGYDNSVFNHPKVFSIVEKPLIDPLTTAIYNALNCILQRRRGGCEGFDDQKTTVAAFDPFGLLDATVWCYSSDTFVSAQGNDLDIAYARKCNP